jgi:histone-lysine N-methyltransferase SETDB1
MNINVGYKGRRLLEPVKTGIFECNSRCKCDHRCSNRVVQNPISVRLQLFKTASKGWGLRCLDDVPEGTFLCVYTGQLLTGEQSDMRGMELGDEYFADLDFIENLQHDYFQIDKSSNKENNEESCDDVDNPDVPKKKNIQKKKRTKQKAEEKRTANQKESFDLLNTNRFFSWLSKYFSYEKDWDNLDVYVMDAKLCGNIGRYFNHSCSPNVMVQNVFVDTYDLRFPWISFFTSQFIKAGTELCWDYNYEVGSVKDKELYCYCGTADCRGRLL